LRVVSIRQPRGVTVARGCQQENRVGLDSPSNKSEHVCGRAVEPVRVLDDEQQRPIVGDLRYEVQRGHRDPVVLRRDLLRQSERGVERVPLDRRELDCALAYGTQQLMQSGKGQMRLGLHAGRGEHGHAPLASLSRGVRKQTRLPDSRLAAEHERLATRRDLVQE